MTSVPQPDPAKPPSPFDAEPGAVSQDFFGSSLEPALQAACGERLNDLAWFRTDWQRGGAVTGYATWCGAGASGGTAEVVVKLPVPPQELRWLQRLQVEAEEATPVVPRLYASGMELGGYDLAWVVMERLRFGPLDTAWSGAEFDLVIEALGRFQAHCSRYAVDGQPPEENWSQLLDKARKTLRVCMLSDAQRWKIALKALRKKFKPLMGHWEARQGLGWCHGDVHLANAMSQQAAPEGPAILFDLARVHVGHWVEDAVYFEHLFWPTPQRVNGRDLVKALARQRKQFELPVEPDWPRLANIRRVQLAIGNLAAQARRPDPAQASAALLMIEKLLPSL